MLRLCAAALLFAGWMTAADPWGKVKELKTGQEVRVIKTGSPTPVLGTFDDLTEENLILVTKKEQSAIPRVAIERIDARPVQGKAKVTREDKVETKDPSPPKGIPNESRTPTTNYSSGVTWGGKPDFETVYRRVPGPTR